MYIKDYQNIKEEMQLFIDEARQNSVLATLFLTLGKENKIYLSNMYYLALRDIVFESNEYHDYEEGTRIITIKDENRGSNITIELIEVDKYNEKLYFIRKVKAKHLEYSFNDSESCIGTILRFECEKN